MLRPAHTRLHVRMIMGISITHTHTHTCTYIYIHTHTQNFTVCLPVNLSIISLFRSLSLAFVHLPLNLSHTHTVYISVRGVIGKVLACSIELNKFELHLNCYVHLHTNIIGNTINSLIPFFYVLNKASSLCAYTYLPYCVRGCRNIQTNMIYFSFSIHRSFFFFSFYALLPFSSTIPFFAFYFLFLGMTQYPVPHLWSK